MKPIKKRISDDVLNEFNCEKILSYKINAKNMPLKKCNQPEEKTNKVLESLFGQTYK
jgi:hypothetical protein